MRSFTPFFQKEEQVKESEFPNYQKKKQTYEK